MHSQFVEQAIIPPVGEELKQALAKYTLANQSLANDRLNLQSALTRRIPDLCPPEREPKLSKKLQAWWELPDFASFRAEIKKVFKADIPLADRTDWEDWITRDRAEIARLSAEITQAETEIDRIVYDLFDLTDDEIALLEENV